MTDDRNSARQQRLRAALRENLKRRKGQLRGRAMDVAAGPGRGFEPANGDAEKQDDAMNDEKLKDS